MTEDELLAAVTSGDTGLRFDDVLGTIGRHWRFTPVAFTNGTVENAAGENAGSCKVLAFAAIHRLTPQQALLLFAEHYQAVLEQPDGHSHANIRAFMNSGWGAVRFHGNALSPLR